MNQYLRQYVNKYYPARTKAITKNLLMQFHITARCDQVCQHCYVLQEPERYRHNLDSELKFDQITKIFDDFAILAQQMEKRAVVELTGGDPLLREDILDIVRYLKAKGLNFGMKGNPFHVPRFIDELKANSLQRYQMSLDGMKSTHDGIRCEGSFDATIEAIRILNRYDIPVVIKYTVSKDNYRDIGPLLNYLYDEGLKIISFAVARYIDVDNIDTMFATPEEMKMLMQYLLPIYEDFFRRQYEDGKLAIYLQFKEHLWVPYLHQLGYLTDELFQQVQPVSNCLACLLTWPSFVLDVDGRVYKCRKIFSSELGDLRETSLLELRPELEKYRNMVEQSECKGCIYTNICMGCPAVSEALKGSIYQRDPGCFLKRVKNDAN